MKRRLKNCPSGHGPYRGHCRKCRQEAQETALWGWAIIMMFILGGMGVILLYVW